MNPVPTAADRNGRNDRTAAVRLVAGREIVVRLRSTSFLVSSFISLLVIVAVAVIPALLQEDDVTTYDVAVAGEGAAELAERLPAVAAELYDDVEIEVVDAGDRASVEQLVRDGELDAAVDGATVLVDEELEEPLEVVLQSAHQVVRAEAALADAGLAGDEVAAALSPAPLRTDALDPPDEVEDEQQGLVFAGTLLLYAQLLGFGYWVASGVVEEKSSRVIELLLAKASPGELLTGKVVGIGLLGFTQLVGFVAFGLIAASVAGSIELPASTIGVAVQVVAWFVLGYAFYACLYAASGALASSAEEMQTTTTPITMLAVGALMAAMFAGGDPGGTLARICTFVPPSAPMVMPIRAAAGELPLWEAVLGVAVVLAATVAAVRLAGRVYAGGALHLRGQMSFKDALAARS
jgi:ABC-2 type transport system permease protein